jgi:hypothetical protein
MILTQMKQTQQTKNKQTKNKQTNALTNSVKTSDDAIRG